MDDNFGVLRVASEGAVAVVTIDNPPTNLVGGPFIGDLITFVDAVEADESIKVVVFRSADPDFFLMHGDVEQLVNAPRRAYEPATTPNVAAVTFERLRRSRVVSIGMIDGQARGGGAEFLTALDLRVGSDRTVLGQPEVPMGILPGAGGTSRLPRLLGRSRALDLILTARDVDANEALAIGWIDRLLPSVDLESHTMALAQHIARMPAASIEAVKRVVDISLRDGDLDVALTAETDALGQLMSLDTREINMRRFLDAGGQTREAELTRNASLIQAMLE
ncbi:MAG TPA: enoyl-CoA hydratase/isomerase family protein [Acidimicrobiales bacterium]|nr:enoyl-CoA hydratase/isomerase family protein [Acidimicrobiales bacterium]